jgi:predicted secreted hydrolase
MRRPVVRSRRAPAALVALVAVVVAACGGPVFANPPAEHPVVTAAPEPTASPADPVSIVLPRDDAPHDRLTEWWYYTGHLVDQAGGRWGFEFVIFRAERGGFPVSWASHLALTDEGGDRFLYAQRAEIGPQVDLDTTGGAGFRLAIRGLDASDPSTFTRAPWSMTGADGRDVLAASASPIETLGDPAAGFGLALTLASTRPAVLHGGDGYIDFGPAGGSYYYSRTAMTAGGTITLGDRELTVEGSAWFDHQWGDFIAVGAGGWDWFAINLEDGTDIMLSLVRAADRSHPLVYGTTVDAAGTTRNLDSNAFTVAVTDHWTSPATGTVYPSGWSISLPADGLVIELSPSVAQQELDTRATTGVIYWEGSQVVRASRGGTPLRGQAYVELTGYAGVR